MNPQNIKFTILITTKNRLEDLIVTLLKINYLLLRDDVACTICDDGSTDGTSSILEGYRRRWGAERLVVVQGPCKGFVANFLSMTCVHPAHADFYAWSDQDDIWHAEKLEAALNELVLLPKHMPVLYYRQQSRLDVSRFS